MFETGKSELAPRSLLAAAMASGALLLSACGQTTPPTPENVQSEIQYVQLPNVKTPKGEPVKCVLYANGSRNTQDSHSWFALTCDFAGAAQFPAGQFPPAPNDLAPTPMSSLASIPQTSTPLPASTH
ncbi:MAG TPA: hypothetical protein VJR27_02275 [Candidatus Saccharimonadales bacterium]|nr:hypothetical protein [Candidatus Saccharimonadales bacterium]